MTGRRIGIVGAGQSGLQLGIGLRQAGHEVILLSNQQAEQIRTGRVSSSQCMFATALGHERALGINFWDGSCPRIDAVELNVASPAQAKAIAWTARLEAPAMSVDQRVKMPAWLQEFARVGGEVRFQNAGVAELEALARECDLLVVAAGKGEVASLFERDAERSRFDRPMRALGLTYVTGLRPRPEAAAVCFNLIPGVGEYFVFPALTTCGPCEIMVFEGVPGGPMDCWTGVRSPDEHLHVSREVLRQFLPWEYERAQDVALTDANGILSGRFPPTVRKPVAKLPSGRLILGMADVVCLNDPITGQGSNNASKCAAAYLSAILDAGTRAFDAAWMNATFEIYWAYARFVTEWTNNMLLPPPPHVLALLGAAAVKPQIAHWFANAFDDPRRYFPRLADPAAAQQFIDSAA
jgi:styrene monooxygenase A-like protein